MAWKTWGLTTLVLGGTAAAIYLAWYELVVPESIASSQTRNLDQATTQLKASYYSLEHSTNLDLLDEPTTAPDKLRSDRQSIANLIANTRQNIGTFETAAQLEEIPYSGITPSYMNSRIKQHRATQIAEQSYDTLRDYADMIAFLEAYVDASQVLQRELDTFNQTSDLNVYAGRGQEVRQTAAAIRTSADALAATTPHELGALKSELISVMRQAADHFDAFATGLDTAIDTQIYAAAALLEASDRDLQQLTGKKYADDIGATRTVKDVQTLREKLDPVLAG